MSSTRHGGQHQDVQRGTVFVAEIAIALASVLQGEFLLVEPSGFRDVLVECRRHLFHQAVVGDVQRCFRLGARDARFQAGHQVDPVVGEFVGAVPALGEVRLEGHGHEDAGVAAHGGAGEVRRRDTHDGEGLAVDLYGLIQNAQVAAELIVEVAVRNVGHRIAAARNIVFGTDQPSGKRLDAEHGEIAAGDQHRHSGDRLAREGEVAGKRAKANHIGDLGVPLQFAKRVPVEDVILAAGIVIPTASVFQIAGRGEQHQLFGMRNRQGTQDDLVQQGKDGGIDADAQAQRCHHDQAQERRLGQAAQRETDTSHGKSSSLVSD